MGQLQVTQVQRRLQDTVMPHVDFTDLAAHGAEEVGRAQLSRSLAAFVVMKLTGLGAADAAATITDGSMDNGVDAIAVLPEEARIVVVQSKWAQDGKGSAALDEMLKFREGLDDLVQLKWDSFNEKVQSRREEIEQLLLEPKVSIDVAFAHMGTGQLADDVRKRMDDYLADLNDPSETAVFLYFGQRDIHRLLIEEQQSPKINLTVELSDWGQVEGPPMAIYGQVKGADVADWYSSYGRPLLDKNVRVVLPDSEVNASLVTTLAQRPEVFWYYNNGVTVLCDQISKAPAGGSDRRVGTFSFEGVSVVNGAQTVGALARAVGAGKRDGLDRARVMVRFISLEGTQADFASEVTRATNTQNRIGGRDFLSLDPEQGRLRDEFAVEQLDYVFRSGETDPAQDKGCSVVEATLALACSQATTGLTTQAKREISRLWEDISKAPYRQLFNPSTTYLRIWRSVQVLRLVDKELAKEARAKEGRARGVAVHGNRFVLHLVFRQLNMAAIDQPGYDWDQELVKCARLIPRTLATTIDVADADFPGYPASLFKNATKSAMLAGAVLRRIQADQAEQDAGSPNPTPDS